MKNINILLVEDNDGDILLTREALEEEDNSIKLNIVQDGEAAIDFINKSGKYKESEKPDFIILDINLPKLNGHEVLKYLKSEEEFRSIPVIILTTSSAKKDVVSAYNNFVNSYVIKSGDYEDYLIAIKDILRYWTKTVILPNN